MDSYFDIKALPDPEIIQSAVTAQLIQALHSILPKYQGRPGLDFPAYGQQRTLGGIIRVIGNQEDINGINTAVLTHATFRDYALVGDSKSVPDTIQKYVCYRRYQVKGNSRFQRHRKRHEARGTWNSEVEQAMLNAFAIPTRLPHVILNSASTGQRFMLFVDKKVKKTATMGEFNTYGLSKDEGTLPVF